MPEAVETIQFFADRGDARLRLDQVLVRRMTGVSRLSRAAVQRWIESGAVTVDGRVARRPSTRLREGAAIQVALPPTAARRSIPAPEAVTIQVLYEDACLIAINKPPGVVVHPSYKQLSGTLLNAVLWRIRDRPDVKPGILTRLDKDTSGVVIVAVSAHAHATMQRDGTGGRIRKEYLAIVDGTPRPPSGTIDAPLARDPEDRRRMMVTPGGAESETRYEVIDTWGGGPSDPPARSLVRCELVTGRTHQIRVHLAAAGLPVVGDPVYGRPRYNKVRDAVLLGALEQFPRQALHAERVVFLHPATREPVEVIAPLPKDLLGLIAHIDLSRTTED